MNPSESNMVDVQEASSAIPGLNPVLDHLPASSLRWGRLTTSILVLIVLGLLIGFLPRWQQRAALRAQTQELAVPTVTVVVPIPSQPATGLALPAEVKPLIEAPIYARASGYLKHWGVDIGAQVEAGQLLAEIDTPELNQELARSHAELTQAEAALALAKTTAARWADLLKTASVSEQETAEKQADLALKTATVEAARANVRRLEELQSFARVTAPFAGTVTARKTDVGELIAAGSGKELFRLAQTRTLRVYVHVPQTLARGVAPGQIAELTIPEMPGRTFSAKVVRTSGAMTADSRTLLTELEVDNARGEILAGSFAQVRFTQAKLDSVLSLPSNTLLFRAEGPQVGIVHPDRMNQRVELRNVTLGRDFGPTVEILSGASASDRVILNPADALISGTIVRIAEGAKTPAEK
jgi:RND family efflux transporter MFP subunit